MKYYAQTNPFGQITDIGQWTVWSDKYCQVRHISADKAVILTGVDYPVRLEGLSRYIKILRPLELRQAPMRSLYQSETAYEWDLKYTSSFNQEIIIPDAHWMDFIGNNTSDNDFVIRDTKDFGKYTKMAMPLPVFKVQADITRLVARSPENTQSGIQRVIRSMEEIITKCPTEHDDMFHDYELLMSAIYSLTGKMLTPASRQFSKRSDAQLIIDLSNAAATIICEIDRIQRKKQ